MWKQSLVSGSPGSRRLHSICPTPDGSQVWTRPCSRPKRGSRAWPPGPHPLKTSCQQAMLLGLLPALSPEPMLEVRQQATWARGIKPFGLQLMEPSGCSATATLGAVKSLKMSDPLWRIEHSPPRLVKMGRPGRLTSSTALAPPFLSCRIFLETQLLGCISRHVFLGFPQADYR